MWYNIYEKGDCDKRFSQNVDVKETPLHLVDGAVFLNLYVRNLYFFLVEYKIAKRDNLCEHCNELKQFRKCHHSYHLPYGRNRLPLCSHHILIIAYTVIFCQLWKPFTGFFFIRHWRIL